MAKADQKEPTYRLTFTGNDAEGQPVTGVQFQHAGVEVVLDQENPVFETTDQSAAADLLRTHPFLKEA